MISVVANLPVTGSFPRATAVLAGDGLLTHAFLTLLREGIAVGVQAEKVVAAGTLLAQRAGLDGMLGGQIIDLSHRGKDGGALAASGDV